MRWNESGWGHFCAHTGYIGPGEPGDGEMSEMTLPSRHWIRNSNPGDLRPSTLLLGHRGSPQYWVFTSGWGKNIFRFFQTAGTGKRNPNSSVEGSGGNHYPRPPSLKVDYTSDQLSLRLTWVQGDLAEPVGKTGPDHLYTWGLKVKNLSNLWHRYFRNLNFNFFNHWTLWIAVPRHSFKWMKIIF